MSSMHSNDANINEYLSDDSLLSVFQFIPIAQLFTLRQVCKRFQQLGDYALKLRTSIAVTIKSDDNSDDEEYESRNDCCDPRHGFTSNDCIHKSCRTVKDGSRTLYVLSEQHLHQLFTFCPNVKALSLESTIFDRNVWQYFGHNCPPGVQHLDFSNSQGLIDEVIGFIVAKCGPTLEHIVLRDSDISEASLKHVLQKCPKLEILDVSRNVRISGHCLSLLPQCVKHLALNNCWNIGFDGIQSLVSGSAKSLQKLEINGEFIDNHMLEEICDHLLDLNHLEMDCSNVREKRVLQRLSNFKRLEQLILILPTINFDNILVDILRNNHKLKRLSLDCGIITDRSITLLPEFCPLLESLSISSGEVVINKQITDESCESLSKLKYLQELDLQYTRIGDKLIEVVVNCPQISTVEIDGCKRVTNKLIDSVVSAAKQRPNHYLSLFARETHLTEPQEELPNNLQIVFN